MCQREKREEKWEVGGGEQTDRGGEDKSRREESRRDKLNERRAVRKR